MKREAKMAHLLLFSSYAFNRTTNCSYCTTTSARGSLLSHLKVDSFLNNVTDRRAKAVREQALATLHTKHLE